MTTGEDVLRHAVDAAAAEFGPSLCGAFALGSLGHGGFAPLVSDVDLMLVLDPVDGSTRSRIDAVRERVRRADPSELAARLSVFWAAPAGVREGAGPHDRLPEVDRMDLLDSGVLLGGTDDRAGASRPETATIVAQAAEFAMATFDARYLDTLGRPDVLVEAGPRPVTKAVLFPVRFLYTLATGRIGRNDDAAAWFPRHHPHGELVTAAMTWRTSGITDPGAARLLLAEHLVPVWSAFARAYVRALPDGDLALRLQEWATGL